MLGKIKWKDFSTTVASRMLEHNSQNLHSSANDFVQTFDGLTDRFFARSIGHLKGCVVLKCSENYGAAHTSTFVTLRKSGKIQKRTKSFAIEWKSCESCFSSLRVW